MSQKSAITTRSKLRKLADEMSERRKNDVPSDSGLPSEKTPGSPSVAPTVASTSVRNIPLTGPGRVFDYTEQTTERRRQGSRQSSKGSSKNSRKSVEFLRKRIEYEAERELVQLKEKLVRKRVEADIAEIEAAAESDDSNSDVDTTHRVEEWINTTPQVIEKDTVLQSVSRAPVEVAAPRETSVTREQNVSRVNNVSLTYREPTVSSEINVPRIIESSTSVSVGNITTPTTPAYLPVSTAVRFRLPENNPVFTTPVASVPRVSTLESDTRRQRYDRVGETERRRESSGERDRKIDQLAEAITGLARPRPVPRQAYELPHFNGDPAEWISYRNMYWDTTELYSFKSHENLARLKTSLHGEAKIAVEDLLRTSTDPSAIMRALEEEFGHPTLVLQCALKKVRDLPRVTESCRELRKFSTTVRNCVSLLKNIRAEGYLNNPQLVSELLNKLTPVQRAQYGDFAMGLDNSQGVDLRVSPSLEIISHFLTHLARSTSYYVQPIMNEPSASKPPMKQQKQVYGQTRPLNSARHVTNKPPLMQRVNAQSDESLSPKECVMCKGEHAIEKCEQFGKLSVQQRWDTIKEKNMCFKCLIRKHPKRFCRADKCEKCGYAHHLLLHADKAQKVNKTESVTNIGEWRASALLKIVPVTINYENSVDVQCYALLDDGATVSLIDNSLAANLEGPCVPLTLKTAGGYGVTDLTSRVVQVQVKGPNGQCHKIKCRTMANISLPTQTVSAATINDNAHLSDLGCVEMRGAKPLLLLGQDNWELLVGQDIRRGRSDCLHLQLYRDPKDRYKKGQTKASLSLQHFLGFESGFTLDKESNTIAIICQDVTVVLAFETRERLIAWQVKVGGQLGSSKEFLVMIGGGGSKKLPAGPARMHLQGRRFALTSGVPPRLLGLWELAHLRRYGVVEGRFCFEGGSHCGKGEGLHMLITDQAQDITDAFDMAAQRTLQRTPAASRKNTGNKTRPSTRLSDFNSTEQSIPDTASALYEENFFGEDCGGVSPYWPSDERRLYDDDVEIGARPPWTGADHITLERCNNCLTKLGAISRSSTVALTPGATFNPAWTMEAVPESSSDNSSNSTEYLTPRAIKKSLEACQCKDKPPERPPKPARLDQKKPPAPLPVQACSCSLNDNNYPANNPKVGPYENYDVPKNTHTEIDPSEHYDTPKRIKQALADDLFKVTNSSAPGSLVLKKNCGCILKFASKKKPVIVECEENIQPVECPCQKVTNWANNLISLPYCKRTSEHVNTEVLTQQKSEEMALYATIDVSRKTNRQSAVSTEKEITNEYPNETQFTNYQNIEPKDVERFEGPYANYENLEFALSLEYYENAKDLLKRAGVTQNELDALSANIDLAVNSMPKKPKLCTKCGHSQTALNKQDTKKTRNDEYLLMEPTNEPKHEFCTKTLGPNPGYTPMSPNPKWSQSLKHPMHKHRVDIEKSLSIPTLTGNESRISIFGAGNNNKESLQKRSSSVDSARLLEDLKEFDSSIGSHATSSSLETLRNLAIENRRTSSPCENETECYDCCKSSGSENKTSEESCSKEIPHLRNKLMDNAQIKRSSSVPCKSGGNRDSSSSNDSGVSSCSMKHGGPDFNEFEMPLTSGHSRYHYMVHKRMRGNLTGCVHSSLPRKSKSSDPLRDMSMQLHKAAVPAKSSSAEAEVPVLPPKQFKGVMDTHSTSSGTSDMSDYIETLSMTSSHSSSDTPMGMRLSRQPTSTLRPRSGKEYHNIDPIITSMYKNGKDLANYTNIP